VTGKYRGRLVRTDLNEEGPFYFIHDENFLDWYERWLDDFIADMSMGSFGGSIAGSQQELRTMYQDEKRTFMQRTIMFGLGRFPKIDSETITLWEDICKAESSEEVCYAALWELVDKRAPNTFDIMQLVFNSNSEKRNACIKLLRRASEHDVDIEPLIPKLLESMPTLNSELFSHAIWAIQETSYNKYANFLPFLELPDNQIKRTVIWALDISADRNTGDFVERILPFFNDDDMEMVRSAILSLMEIQDDRIPPLVDEAYRRFPEFEMLCKNYYRRTWGKTDIN